MTELIQFNVLIILSLITIILLTVIIKMIINTYKSSDKETKNEMDVRFERMKLLLSEENIIEKVINIVDECIKRAADTYLIINIGPDKEKYLNSADSDEMIQYITYTVNKNLTPEMISLIRIIQNINSDKDLDDFIALRIKLYVLAILVDKNQLINE